MLSAKVRGVYRYETAPGRWWACAEDETSGERVNMQRTRYEQKRIAPPFEGLPLETDSQREKRIADA
jgi:hypothetical protein